MAPNARFTQRRRFWHLAGLMTPVVFLPGAPTPAQALEDAINPPQPPITIVVKGGAGTIKADRAWNDGDKLCWESRGVRNCTLRRWVSHVRYSGLPDHVGTNDASSPRPKP
jgi:hypothetical protein